MITLESLKLNFAIEAPQTYENLTVYPLVGQHNIDLDYLTLDEALRSRFVEIDEVRGGRVSALLVINNAQRDVLIISGEELLGAMQNRTINVSIIIAAQSSLRVPVSCTERGRWRAGEDGIRMRNVSAHYSPSSLRGMLTSSVTASLEREDSYDSDQVGVWDTISGIMGKLNVSSRTSAQSDIFEEMEEEIDDSLRRFHPLPNQIGVVGLINGQIVSLELFGRTDTFSKMFGRLLRSFIVDAISERKQHFQGDENIRDFLSELKEAKIESRKAPGKGEHLIIESQKQKGIALEVSGEIIHLLLSSKRQVA